jgi:hypothetical protein
VKVYPGGVVRIKIWRIKKRPNGWRLLEEHATVFCHYHAWINSGDESIVGWSLLQGSKFSCPIEVALHRTLGLGILHASSIETGALNPL